VYHSIIEEARVRRLNLVVLTLSQPIPASVGAVITTESESEAIDFNREKIIIADGRPQAVIDKATSLLSGEDFEQIIIGIDPGKFPGMAVLGDNKTISVHHVSVGEVCPHIRRIMQDYRDKKILVRIGHGARLIRSQLINGILDLGLEVEMVDETGTTPHLGKGRARAGNLRHHRGNKHREDAGKKRGQAIYRAFAGRGQGNTGAQQGVLERALNYTTDACKSSCERGINSR